MLKVVVKYSKYNNNKYCRYCGEWRDRNLTLCPECGFKMRCRVRNGKWKGKKELNKKLKRY